MSLNNNMGVTPVTTLPVAGADAPAPAAAASSFSPAPTPALTWQMGWRYGLMGLPLAFVALPLYVLLPNHYARSFGVPLATLGAALLAVRLADTFIDPLLGRWADQMHSPRATLRWAGALALALSAGFVLLFFPPAALQADATALLLWLVGALALTTLTFSALTILHQAWGARLGGDALYRSRVVAWREGLGLVGVLVASISPVALGLPATAAIFCVALLGAWLAWGRAPAPPYGLIQPQGAQGGAKHPADIRPAATTDATGALADQTAVNSATRQGASLRLPWTRSAFRRLMAVFVVNGISSAVPATLLLFFVQDRLQAPASAEPLFLGAYFACAALSIALWLRAVPRWGLARVWLAGMVLAVAVFAFTAGLQAGNVAAFVLVCALSGVALGTDLALPAALLVGVIQRSGDQQHAEGAYFGWWAFATKLNLALAAGLALPALGALGYSPGSTDPHALKMLTLAYCVLPCVLKSISALLLYTLIIRKTP